ncbi:GIY-YIG nuclease family protein [Ammoniphilus sp. CFH 90114]|uniref:GIY-YIG nuclease family protein n=1 Tax=Ammoniphilus sp. CFH 90114 TaxID=2493665 RepID=UPI00196B689D|nr:GIY-YIG nuclease family protein [Ammoniphilus sp. CFH 90114]
MLRCKDSSLYTGITNDIEKRVKKHNSGKASRYTRARLPVKMVYLEQCENKSAALRREIEIKRYTKSEKERLLGVAGLKEDPNIGSS